MRTCRSHRDVSGCECEDHLSADDYKLALIIDLAAMAVSWANGGLLSYFICCGSSLHRIVSVASTNIVEVVSVSTVAVVVIGSLVLAVIELVVVTEKSWLGGVLWSMSRMALDRCLGGSRRC